MAGAHRAALLQGRPADVITAEYPRPTYSAVARVAPFDRTSACLPVI